MSRLSRPSPRWASLGLASAVLTASFPATAATAATAAPALSEAMDRCTKLTNDLSSDNKYEEAAQEGNKCWEEFKLPQFLFLAAKFWGKSGHHAHAIDTIRRYQREVKEDKPERRRSAPDLLKSELQHTGAVSLEFDPALRPDEKVTLVVTPQPNQGATVPPLEFIATSESPVKLDLDPGTWNLEFTREGFEKEQHEIIVPPDRASVTSLMKAVELPPVKEEHTTPPPDLPPEQPKPPPWKGLAIGGGIAVGAGAAMLAIATGFAVKVYTVQGHYDEADCTTASTDKECNGWADSGKKATNPQIAGLVSGPILLSAGVAMLVIAMRRKALQPKLAISPIITPQVVGLSWRLRF